LAWIGTQNPWELDGDSTSATTQQHGPKAAADVDSESREIKAEAQEMKATAAGNFAAAAAADDDDDDDDADIDDIINQTHHHKAEASDVKDDDDDDDDSFSDLYPGFFAFSSS